MGWSVSRDGEEVCGDPYVWSYGLMPYSQFLIGKTLTSQCATDVMKSRDVADSSQQAGLVIAVAFGPLGTALHQRAVSRKFYVDIMNGGPICLPGSSRA
jgi:hypothetical protein